MVCRICSEDLTQAQFDRGEAIELDCECKGNLVRVEVQARPRLERMKAPPPVSNFDCEKDIKLLST